MTDGHDLSLCLCLSPLTVGFCPCSDQSFSSCNCGALLHCCADGCLCIHCLSGLQVSNRDPSRPLLWIFSGDITDDYMSVTSTMDPLSYCFLSPRRYKVYRPVHRPLLANTCCHAGVRGRIVQLREAFLPSNEESHHLLTERRAL